MADFSGLGPMKNSVAPGLVLFIGLAQAACWRTPQAIPLPTPPSLVSMELTINGAFGSRGCVHQFPYMQLQVVGTTAEGKQVHSTTYFRDGAPILKEGTIANDTLEISVSHGAISPYLLFTPPVNDFDLLGRNIEFRARVRDTPEVAATLTLGPDFHCPSVIDIRGRDGLAGSPGQNGGDGEDGPKVNVMLTYLKFERYDGPPLALAKVTNAQTSELMGYYIFSPKHGIRFDVSGGFAGAGGTHYTIQSVHSQSTWGKRSLLEGPTVSEATHPGGFAGRAGRSGSANLQVDDRFPALANSVQVTRNSGATQTPHMPPSFSVVSASVAFAQEFAKGLPIVPIATTSPSREPLAEPAGEPLAE